jgi:hypothetical protein
MDITAWLAKGVFAWPRFVVFTQGGRRGRPGKCGAYMSIDFAHRNESGGGDATVIGLFMLLLLPNGL